MTASILDRYLSWMSPTCPDLPAEKLLSKGPFDTKRATTRPATRRRRYRCAGFFSYKSTTAQDRRIPCDTRIIPILVVSFRIRRIIPSLPRLPHRRSPTPWCRERAVGEAAPLASGLNRATEPLVCQVRRASAIHGLDAREHECAGNNHCSTRPTAASCADW